MEQLILPVSVSEHMVFDSFYPGSILEIYQSNQDHIQKLLFLKNQKLQKRKLVELACQKLIEHQNFI